MPVIDVDNSHQAGGDLVRSQGAIMQALAKYIAYKLKTDDHCAVYEVELDRVRPRNGVRRQTKIEKFAKDNGWRVGHYKDGFVAIFVKTPSASGN